MKWGDKIDDFLQKRIPVGCLKTISTEKKRFQIIMTVLCLIHYPTTCSVNLPRRSRDVTRYRYRTLLMPSSAVKYKHILKKVNI